MKIDKKNSAGERTGVTYICDSCEEKSPFRYTVCSICGKDICRNCRIDATPDAIYTCEWYCSSCFEIKDRYKKEVEKAEEKYLIKLKNILEKYTRLSVKLGESVMSYSRWGSRGSGHWYTFWCVQAPGVKETKDNALFTVFEICSFTAKQLRNDIEKCIRVIANKDRVSEKKLLDELKIYMNEFLADVKNKYSGDSK